jgi:hypothetical protein
VGRKTFKSHDAHFCRKLVGNFRRSPNFSITNFAATKFPSQIDRHQMWLSLVSRIPFHYNSVVLRLPSDTRMDEFPSFQTPAVPTLCLDPSHPPLSAGSVSFLSSSNYAFHDFFLHSHTTPIHRCTRTDEFICDRSAIASVYSFSLSGPPLPVGGVENVPS